MSTAAKKKTELKDVSAEQALKASKSKKEKTAEEADENEEGGRARSTYYVVTVVQHLGGKKEALKYLKQNKLEKDQVLLKAREVEMKPIQGFTID